MTPSPSYWEALSTRDLIEKYLNAHAGKLEDEGLHVRAIALREAIRRLEDLSDDPR